MKEVMAGLENFGMSYRRKDSIATSADFMDGSRLIIMSIGPDDEEDETDLFEKQ